MPRVLRPVLYVAPGSSSCLESIRMLTEAQVDYVQHDVSREPAARSALLHEIGRLTVPTLVWGRHTLVDYCDWELVQFVRQHRPRG
ncbi:glutaredoxin family protein [Synoicihabitans lomoniglobus]|uniref:Glutaredoxin domain-containing protein n=1 Tax=Synoicihabitans lomoniglobus TaxID=2909285 RepID=A0AAF0I2V2_9BACT|nr:hypothetical protein [Opitutaceae bacterium LMO-M01]WED66747.1 glutaredoxin domain-containing protein [Opitutaceae bacterium LMO-M01]